MRGRLVRWREVLGRSSGGAGSWRRWRRVVDGCARSSGAVVIGRLRPVAFADLVRGRSVARTWLVVDLGGGGHRVGWWWSIWCAVIVGGSRLPSSVWCAGAGHRADLIAWGIARRRIAKGRVGGLGVYGLLAFAKCEGREALVCMGCWRCANRETCQVLRLVWRKVEAGRPWCVWAAGLRVSFALALRGLCYLV